MAVTAFGSVRSCGVTTLALGMATTWPADQRVLLVEADPAGGTLAAASGWPAEPSLVTLAAAARRGGDPALVWEHCHQLPGGVPALAAPAAGDQARSALGMLGPLLARLDELDANVLVDCGRLDSGSPTLSVWERADRPVVVARPRLADLQAVASWIDGRSLDGRVGLVLVGDGPYPDAEVTEALGLPVLSRLPWDPGTADVLVSLPAAARPLRLAPLVRAARTLADELARPCAPIAAPSTEETSRAAEVGRGARGAGIGSRVLRAWRAEMPSEPSNGSVPEEASR